MLIQVALVALATNPSFHKDLLSTVKSWPPVIYSVLPVISAIEPQLNTSSMTDALKEVSPEKFYLSHAFLLYIYSVTFISGSGRAICDWWTIWESFCPICWCKSVHDFFDYYHASPNASLTCHLEGCFAYFMVLRGLLLSQFHIFLCVSAYEAGSIWLRWKTQFTWCNLWKGTFWISFGIIFFISQAWSLNLLNFQIWDHSSSIFFFFFYILYHINKIPYKKESMSSC